MATKKTFYQELINRRDKYKKALLAIEALLEIEKENSDEADNEVNSEPISRHANYGVDSLVSVTIENLYTQVVPVKVLFALRLVKKGTAKDVAEKLKELIPAYSENRAHKDARHHLSKFKVAGVIQSETIGNKNLYAFPQADIEEITVENLTDQYVSSFAPEEDLPF